MARRITLRAYGHADGVLKPSAVWGACQKDRTLRSLKRFTISLRNEYMA